MKGRTSVRERTWVGLADGGVEGMRYKGRP
jgi:hypothetical protein